MDEKRKPGRQPTYDAAALKRQILDSLSAGKSLNAICKEDGFPAVRTVRDWESEDESFAADSLRAREIGCHVLADECLEISNTPISGEIRTVKADGSIETRTEDMLGHRRLQIDTRMRLLGKWLPRVYGEKLEIAGELTHKKAAADMTDEELLLIARGRQPNVDA